MILQKARVYMVGKIHRFFQPRQKADTHPQDIHVAFNYGQQTGSAQLLRFITEHTEVIEIPGNPGWPLITSSDCTSPSLPGLAMLHECWNYICS